MATRHLRRKERHLLDGLLRVSWQDRQGQFKMTEARGIDISEFGMSIQLPEPVEIRSVVNLRAEKHRLVGSASVRYCRRIASKYIVGLEFTGGLRWNPPIQPEAPPPAPSGHTQIPN